MWAPPVLFEQFVEFPAHGWRSDPRAVAPCYFVGHIPFYWYQSEWPPAYRWPATDPDARSWGHAFSGLFRSGNHVSYLGAHVAGEGDWFARQFLKYATKEFRVAVALSASVQAVTRDQLKVRIGFQAVPGYTPLRLGAIHPWAPRTSMWERVFRYLAGELNTASPHPVETDVADERRICVSAGVRLSRTVALVASALTPARYRGGTPWAQLKIAMDFVREGGVKLTVSSTAFPSVTFVRSGSTRIVHGTESNTQLQIKEFFAGGSPTAFPRVTL